MKHSFPKNKIKALLLEGVHIGAKEKLEKEGYLVEYLTTALPEDELIEKIKDVHLLGIRSKTQVTKKVIESANRLYAICAFCIGTNQIDLETASEKGISVFNAPYSNTRSVVELAIAEMIILIRNLPDKMNAMHDGKWEKSASNSRELRGKKLGIVGYGNIGSQLSVLAEGMGLDVYYFDLEEKLPLGNATKVDDLHEMLGSVDIVSLHIDGRPENDFFFGEKEFDAMLNGCVFLNLARGKVVDVEALRKAIDSGKVQGAGVDVYPIEPKSNDEPFESDLAGARNTILTPHIGGSTEEAQEHIGSFVPGKFIEYMNSGSTSGSVNMPNVQLPSFTKKHRFLHIHKNVPNVMAQINQILASHNMNISGQYLKTNESTGYVIVDVDQEYDQRIVEELKAVNGTVKFRILY